MSQVRSLIGHASSLQPSERLQDMAPGERLGFVAQELEGWRAADRTAARGGGGGGAAGAASGDGDIPPSVCVVSLADFR